MKKLFKALDQVRYSEPLTIFAFLGTILTALYVVVLATKIVTEGTAELIYNIGLVTVLGISFIYFVSQVKENYTEENH